MQQPEPLENPAKRQAVAPQSRLNHEIVSVEVADNLKAAGALCFKQKDYAKAKEHLEQALVMYEILHQAKPHQNIAEVLYILSDLFKSQQDDTKAKECYKRAVAIMKSMFSETSFKDIDVTLSGQKRKVNDVESEPSNPETTIAQTLPKVAREAVEISEAKKAREQGDRCYRQQDLHSTIAYYEKAITIAPDYLDAYHNLACFYHIKGELVKAEACFKKGLATNKSETYCEYGQFLFQRGAARWPEAAAMLQQAIELNTPDSGLSFNKLEIVTLNDKALEQMIEWQDSIEFEAIIFAYYILVKGFFNSGDHFAVKDWLKQFSGYVKTTSSVFNQYLLILACDYVGLNAEEKASYIKKAVTVTAFDLRDADQFQDKNNRDNDLNNHEYYQYALKVYEALHKGQPHEDMGEILRRLGNAHSKRKEYNQAKQCYEQALTNDRAVYLGYPHIDIGKTLNVLGNNYYAQQEYDKAIESYEQALMINETVLQGMSHEGMGVILQNLGNTYRAKGAFNRVEEYYQRLSRGKSAFNKAEEYFQRALVIYEAVYKGRPHKNIGSISSVLGRIYFDRQDHAKAKEYYERALLTEEALHEGQPDEDISAPLRDLGNFYLTQQDFAKAKEYYERALINDDIVYEGTPHENVGEVLRALGYIYLEQKNYAKAKEYCKRALGIYEALYDGRPHQNTYTTFQAFSKACSEQIASEQAAALAKIASQKAAEKTPQYLEAKKAHQQGDDCYAQQDLESAIWHYEIAINLVSDYFAAYNGLACVYHVKGELAKAEDCFKKGLASDNAAIYCAYGQFLFQQGMARWPEAVAVLEKSIALNTADSVVIYKKLEAATLDNTALQQIVEQQGEIRIVAELLAYYLLVKGFCRAGEKQVARQWLEQFSENVKLNPSEVHQHLLTLASDEVGLNSIERVRCLALPETVEAYNKLLLKAAEQGNVAEIVNCLNNAADIEIRDSEQGFPPLILAIRGRHVAAVDTLLEQKANIHAKDNLQITAFHHALMNTPNAAIASLLIRHGATFDTPWHEAAYYGDIAKLNTLLSQAIDKSLLPLLYNAGNPFLFYAVANGKLEVLEWYRQNAVFLSVQENIADQQAKWAARQKYRGDTLLLFSVVNDKLPIADWLIREGISTLEEKNSYSQTAMLLAIENGHLLLAQWLLSKGASIEDKDNYGKTAVFYAIKNGHLAILQWLVQQGASVHEKHENDYSAVHVAAQNNQFALIPWLVTQGVSWQDKTKSGQTVLLLTAEKGHLSTLEWLLNQGVDLEENSGNGVTALMLAAKHGHSSLVKLLLTRGASVTAKHCHGHNALLMAVAEGHLEIVELLIQHGARLDNGTEMNQAFALALSSGDVRLFDRLIELGFDIKRFSNHFNNLQFSATTIKWLLSKNPTLLESTDASGSTPLMIACDRKREKIAKCLVKLGAKLDAESNDERNVISHVNAYDCEFVLWLLKQKGAPLAKKSNYKRWSNMLEKSIVAGNIALARRMVELGTPLNLMSQEGRFPISSAIDFNRIEFAEWLMWERGVSLECKSFYTGDQPLHCAVTDQTDLAFIKKLVSLSYSLEIENKSGNTPLLQAAEYGNLSAAQYLVKKGALHKATSKTTLMVAARAGQVAMVEWLLQQGVSLEEKDSHGQTALMYMFSDTRNVPKESKEVIAKLLIKHGAKLNVQDNEGNTPLLLAAKYPDEVESVVSYMVEHGASLKFAEGESTLLVAAIYANNITIARWLIMHGAQVNSVPTASKTHAFTTTALITAVYRNQIDFAKRLIEEKNASLEAVDSQGKTALFYALECRDETFVHWLIQRGANVNTRNKKGETPLYMATRTNDLSIITLLLKKGAIVEKLCYDPADYAYNDNTAVDLAMRQNNIAKIIVLLQYGWGIGLESYSTVYVNSESEQSEPLKNESLKQGVMHNQLVIGMKIHGKRVTRKTPGFEKAITTLAEFFDYQNSFPIPPANCLAYIRACNHYLATHLEDDEIRDDIIVLKRHLVLKQSSLVQACLSFIRERPALRERALSAYLPIELKAQIEHEPEVKIDGTRFAQNK